MDNERVGSFIRDLRKEKGLTQKELASKLGLTDKAISKWERGLGCPDISLLEDIADYLDVSVLELIKGKRLDSGSKYNNKDIIDTMKYSRKSITGVVRKNYKIFACAVMGILIIFLVVTNLKSILFEMRVIDVVDEYGDSDYYEERKNYLKELIVDTNNKIDIVFANRGKFTAYDYNIVLRAVESIDGYLEMGNYEIYLDKDSYSYLELLDFYVEHEFIRDEFVNYIEVYEVLLKYDNTLGDELISYNYGEDVVRDSYGSIFSYLEQPYYYVNMLSYREYIPNVLSFMFYVYDNYNDLLSDIVEVGEME